MQTEEVIVAPSVGAQTICMYVPYSTRCYEYTIFDLQYILHTQGTLYIMKLIMTLKVHTVVDTVRCAVCA